jgi:murein DD-endopeptidase MepM/ murein hydrolase activator NlpD
MINIMVGTTILVASSVYAYSPEMPPFYDSQPFNLTRGYQTPTTHLGKEKYALDFAQGGCDAFDKPVVAIADGEVVHVNTIYRDYRGDGGFGLNIKLRHSDGTFSRYAHLDKVFVTEGEVKAGQVIGLIGNTGNVTGTSCPDYPGTHLHFVMYNSDGSAYLPEPMEKCRELGSGKTPCTNFTAGH